MYLLVTHDCFGEESINHVRHRAVLSPRHVLDVLQRFVIEPHGDVGFLSHFNYLLSCGKLCAMIARSLTQHNEYENMNISLTLNFDTIAEMEAYLVSRTAGKQSTPTPAATPVAATPTPAAPAPVVSPVAAVPAATPAAAPALAAVPATAPAEDAATLKARIMDRLKAIAQSLPDQSELGKFITGFGVARFSDLPDTHLAQFEDQMNRTYPAA